MNNLSIPGDNPLEERLEVPLLVFAQAVVHPCAHSRDQRGASRQRQKKRDLYAPGYVLKVMSEKPSSRSVSTVFLPHLYSTTWSTSPCPCCQVGQTVSARRKPCEAEPGGQNLQRWAAWSRVQSSSVRGRRPVSGSETSSAQNAAPSRNPRTDLTLSAIPRNPLSAATPANFLSLVIPVKYEITAPCENPPTTIRSDGIPASTSCAMREEMVRTEESMPTSSSARMPACGFSSWMSNLTGGGGLSREVKLSKESRGKAHQDVIRL